jgi:hypothetical protein
VHAGSGRGSGGGGGPDGCAARVVPKGNR